MIEVLPLVSPLPLSQAVVHQLVLVTSIQTCNKPKSWRSDQREQMLSVLQRDLGPKATTEQDF